MDSKPLPSRWARSEKAIRAVQVAFDVEEQVLQCIRQAAFANNLSTSDQIRAVLGLPVTRQAKRPRLTVSLSEDDYALLAQRYRLPADARLDIKECALRDLQQFAQNTARQKAD